MRPSKIKFAQSGFTLIELIVVIVLLGILSITVIPKFLDSKGFQEYTYRSDVIAKLRLIQTRAMQQVNTNYCHRVFVSTTKLGLPDRNNCDDSPTFSGNERDNVVTVEIASNDAVIFTSNATNNTFTFDSLGRPQGCAPCDITISGEQTLTVRVESEGYIHGL
jgi:MSHA pilin protein MshC